VAEFRTDHLIRWKQGGPQDVLTTSNGHP